MDKLLFVYNANSGLFDTLTDYAHKIISPDTYSCNLCKLTYGNFGMKREWKDFIDSISADKDFLHRDEFLKNYPQFADVTLPSIFALGGELPVLLLPADTINRAKNLKELKELLSGKILQNEKKFPKRSIA
ncbi:hypothetical protein HYV56_00390 [Candidatus Peregrinibacteria bacterium]|nr:hypothetical protein [Candidatus Peregrinibacteria bacterium]